MSKLKQSHGAQVSQSRGQVALGEPLRDRLREYLKVHGEQDAEAALGLSRATLARALAGLTVYPATLFMIETRLAAAAAQPESP